MNNNSKTWMLPAVGSLLFAAAAHAQQPPPAFERAYLDSTNRLTGSLRFGLNISGKFKGIGGNLNPGAPASNRRTGHGDPYNYVDGYVLTDVSGNAGGQTWYWGYDNSSQVGASGANTIDFHRNTASNFPQQNSGDDSPYIGCELTYNHQLGAKEDWHHLRYGIEAAANYMPIDFNSGGTYNTTVNQTTDTYGYTAGTTPPGAPYQGGYGGPGFVLNANKLGTTTTAVPGATLEAHQHFNANLFGFRLGPYIEVPLTEKFSLHASGGFAAGLLDASANWKEVLTLPGGGGTVTTQGGGNDFDVLYGFYAGVDAIYQFNERWSLDVGAQFQNLGTYDHNFGGRTAELDLSKSIFVQLGLSYSF
jgi:hypothetical protein